MVRRALFPLLIVLSMYAQSPLPRFDGEALSGLKVTMPGAVNGHAALLVIGFTHASGPHCTDWSKRLESEFRSDTALERYTVVFLEDAPKLVRGVAIHGIKSGVPKEEYNNFLIVTAHAKEVQAAVRFSAPDDAYLVLLGGDGTIRWTFHGPISDDPIRQLRELLH